MNPKFLNALAQVWFMSVIVCLIIEGSQMGTTDTTIIHDLTSFGAMNISDLAGFLSATASFFKGIVRILAWDYSFYQGAWQYVRYFWMVMLTPGMIWGITQTFAPVVANMLRFG